MKLISYRLKSTNRLDQIRRTCNSEEEYTQKIVAMMNQVRSGGDTEETQQISEGSSNL